MASMTRRGITRRGITRRGILASAAMAPLVAKSATLTAETARKQPDLAPTPPMGWNSWNSFAVTITEAQAMETAQIMASELLPFGYRIFTIDHQWYDPRAKGYEYNSDIDPVMDGYGRFLPAPGRFPASVGGKGFGPMARQLHALGLQFGLHRMRGIPRAAVKANLPIIGTRYRAQDIADISSTCSWNVDMYGVDMRKPGAQAYYDSVFAQYAHWGVDFVKVDDLSRPYDAHAPEIEAIALAIARSGRPMILSMSPGETPLVKANHVKRHAQMWRISDDFWDDWALLEAQFTRLENWSVHCGDGHWPDADMLPLGRIAMGSRDSRLTPDEQRTLMTLWSIARSPLIMGGDLRHLDAPTLALLTNPEVVAVNQHSHLNKPVFWQDGYRLWTARPKDGDGLYIALFNTASAARKIELPWAALGFAAPPHRLRDLWARTDLAAPGYSMSTEIPAHGAQLFLAR